MPLHDQPGAFAELALRAISLAIIAATERDDYPMNDPHDTPFSGGDHADELASDIDPRFDPAASGTDIHVKPDVKPAQQQLEEIAASCNAWVRAKPLQALTVAAGLGFLLGRIGR